MQIVLKKVFHGNKRQMITAAAACFIVYVLLLSGIFSYFHSEDTVTNRLDAKNGSVLIQEPQWDSIGQYKARASEPGMKIEKDPSGYNNGQVDLYIRLKMTIDASSYTAKNDTYEASFPNNEANRFAAILDAIKLKNGDPFLNPVKTATNNTGFIMDTATESGKTVYYFYFTGENADTMKIVKPKEPTDDLFDHIDIPFYKKDYFGVFDQKYDIILEAEGVPASSYPNGLTVDEAKGENSPFSG